MVRYYMKNNREENFESVRHIVLVEDMNDGILEHAKFGKVGLNNCVSLLHNNILQKAHQWAHFRMKNYLGATLPGIFPSHVQEWPILPQSKLGHSIPI